MPGTTSSRSPAAPPAPPGPPKPGASRSLVVVSNRLPFVVEPSPRPRSTGARFTRAAGGLVAALDPVLAARGGVWIGWAGLAQDPGAPTPALPAATKGVRYHAVPLSARDVSLYYAGFSNRTLWPLFHYFVSRTRIDAGTWAAYERVNERFARAVLAESGDEDVVWVHDYQLLRVAHHLRHLAPQRRIAFFLHIPFPSYDVFRVLPWSRQLMRGLLAADLVGVHVPGYADHVFTCAERLLGCDTDRAAGIVLFEGRAVSVQSHPIGIDVDRVEALARGAAGPQGAETVFQVIGLDRLDYTKGIYERLLAVERFFERHAQFRGRVVFTQVLIPSRADVAEYRDLKRELDETVGRINGRFAEGEWTPIRYLVRSLSPEELGVFYRRADVALVTPLRDGMNLVAKEYVAAQVDRPGVLILSEMAGAAEELQEALLVNPFDPDAVADALHRAVTMPEDERRARMSALRDRVRANSVSVWVERFLEAAEQASTHAPLAGAAPVDRVRRRLASWLAARPAVALFFDYDGTLTPIRGRPEEAVLSEGARRALEQAAVTPNLDTVIVSGRALADVRALVGVPSLVYIGNHGFEIEGPGISYRHPGLDRFADAVRLAAADLAALEVPGAHVELKGATLSYHVRDVAERARADAVRQAERTLRRRRLRVTQGRMVVEGRPPVDWHKGRAVLHVLVQRHGANWPAHVRALYVGDDATDEDAFRSLHGIGRSIRVGPLPAQSVGQADYSLPDPDAVAQLLRWLAAGAFATG